MNSFANTAATLTAGVGANRNLEEEKVVHTWHHPPPISAIKQGKKESQAVEEEEEEGDPYSSLPMLDDVLHRRTRPPICLYNYYIVLRDRLKMDHVLDFWLDVSQAHILQRKYLKHRAKLQKQQQPHNISTLSNISTPPITPTTTITTTPTNTVTFDNDPHYSPMKSYPRPSIATSTMTSSYDSLFCGSFSSQQRIDKIVDTATRRTTKLKYQKKRVPPPTQTDMLNIIERIYLKYIAPSSEKEITQLPAHIKLLIKDKMESFANSSSNSSSSNDGSHGEDSEGKQQRVESNDILITLDIFNEAHDYVYHHILQKLTYPLFLKYKVKMNLTLPQQITRFVLGLMFLWVGFSFEFSLIFLNIQPWQKRLWGSLPITLGVFCMISSITGVDPIWVLLFNISETVPFHFNSILQHQVRKILIKRAWIILSIILFIIFLFMLFFCSVAGKRL